MDGLEATAKIRESALTEEKPISKPIKMSSVQQMLSLYANPSNDHLSKNTNESRLITIKYY